MKGYLVFVFSFIMAICPSLMATPCLEWANPEQIGVLDAKINESSGMDISQKFPNHVYHINDSGSRGEFLVTDLTGQLLEKVSIKNFNPLDTEDMSVGPCGTDSCIFVADVGDNLHFRTTGTIIAIKEKSFFNGSADIFASFKIKYPDRIRHDVESMAIHPNGDLVIFTKDFNKTQSVAESAKVFWLPKQELWADLGSTKILRDIGSIDIPQILGNRSESSLATAMSIHPQGDRFTVLTYSSLIEFNFDLTKGIKSPLTNVDYTVLPMVSLRQQESVAYSTIQDAIIYTTEDSNAPLYQVHCNLRETH